MTSRGSEKKGSNNERKESYGNRGKGKSIKTHKRKKYERQTLRTGRNEETMNLIWGN